ncbi:diguanylate cyclase domain-containing protein [Sphingomonas sp. NCPPB 2930]
MRKFSFSANNNKFLLLMVPVLLFAQLTAFFVLIYYNSQIANETVDSALDSGAKAYLYSALVRRESRQQAANLTARDYSLQYVFSTGARSTIESALKSHLLRTGANLIVLENSENKIIARTQVATENIISESITDAYLSNVLHNVAIGQRNIVPIQLNNTPVGLYLWVKAVIRAPRPIGAVYLAYKIDDTIAEGFSKITGLGISFWGRIEGGEWFKYASSGQFFDISSNFEKHVLHDGPYTLNGIDGNDYRIKGVNLAKLANSHVVSVVSKEFAPVLKPFAKLKLIFGMSILLSSIVCITMAFRISRVVVNPLLEHAHKDALTGLLNRRAFDNSIKNFELDYRKKGAIYTVMLLDLNKFKPINDTYGHEAGDEVLKEVAVRISNTIRRGDVLARLGGDEFAIIINGVDKSRLTSLVHSIENALMAPITLKKGNEIVIGCSIGLATVEASDIRAADVLHRADQAMYAAKGSAAR